MDDRIRIDTGQTADLAAQLVQLADELDRQVMQLRMAQLALDQPAALCEDVSRMRRSMMGLIDRIVRLARRVRLMTEMFEDNEQLIAEIFYTQNDVYQSFRTSGILQNEPFVPKK